MPPLFLDFLCVSVVVAGGAREGGKERRKGRKGWFAVERIVVRPTGNFPALTAFKLGVRRHHNRQRREGGGGLSLPPPPRTSRPQASVLGVAEGLTAGFKAWVGPREGQRRVVRLEVSGEGCRCSPGSGVVFAATAAAAHVAIVGERAGSLAATVSRRTAVMGLSKLTKGWRKGAVKGNAEDQCLLAECHGLGQEGVKRDKVAAAAWRDKRDKAAEQQHAAAQACLGICYARGDGVGQNLELAATFYRQAADAGHALGQGLLGGCYALGEGLEQNDALAVKWWEKGAVKGDTLSQVSLGRCYMDGTRGLPKSAPNAKIFMMAAADQGSAEAIAALKLLRLCTSCGAPDATRTCLGCRTCTGISMSRYCTPECQEKDWKFHKLDCGGRKACECRNCVSDRGESSTSAAPA